MGKLTYDQAVRLLKQVDEARARGDEATASTLLRSVPLGKKMTEYMVNIYGKEALLNSGFKPYGGQYS